MQDFSELILIYLVCALFFSVLLSYGYILTSVFNNNQKNINHFCTFYFGSILIFLIQFLLYLIFKINFFSNLIIISFGLFFFFKNYNTFKKDFIIFLKILAFTFIIIIISKTHEDFKHHHFQIVNEIFNFKLTLGKGNAYPQFIYIPSLAYIISITKIPFFINNFFHVIPFIFLVSFFGYSYKEIKKRNNNLFAIFVITIFILIYFKSLKKFGFDVPALIVALIAYFEIIKEKSEKIRAIILYLFAISIKITIIISAPLFIYYFFKNNNLK